MWCFSGPTNGRLGLVAGHQWALCMQTYVYVRLVPGMHVRSRARGTGMRNWVFLTGFYLLGLLLAPLALISRAFTGPDPRPEAPPKGPAGADGAARGVDGGTLGGCRPPANPPLLVRTPRWHFPNCASRLSIRSRRRRRVASAPALPLASRTAVPCAVLSMALIIFIKTLEAT